MSPTEPDDPPASAPSSTPAPAPAPAPQDLPPLESPLPRSEVLDREEPEFVDEPDLQRVRPLRWNPTTGAWLLAGGVSLSVTTVLVDALTRAFG